MVNLAKHPQRPRCPYCEKYDFVGDNGYGRFFCADCCVQFKFTVDKKTKSNIIQCFIVDEEGKVIKRHTGLLRVQELKEFCNETD